MIFWHLEPPSGVGASHPGCRSAGGGHWRAGGKDFEGGRAVLSSLGVPIESLVKISSLDNNTITFTDESPGG